MKGWIILLTLGALGVRLVGIDALLPHLPEPDTYLVRQADLLNRTAEERVVGADLMGKYPLLTPWLLSRFQPAHPPPVAADLGAQLADASAPIRRARLLVACLSVLIVPGTWWLARLYASRGAATLSAALMASCLLHQLYSVQARPHAVMTSLLVLALAASIGYLRAGGARRALLAGALAALTIGSLQTGMVMLAPLLIAGAWRLVQDGRRAALPLLAALLLVVLGVALFLPSEYFGLGSTLVQKRTGGMRWGGMNLPRFPLDMSGYALILPRLWSTDPVLLIGACSLPLAWMLGRRAAPAERREVVARRLEALALASVALPLLAFCGIFNIAPARYLVPLMPLLAVATALAWDRVAAGRPRLGPALAVLLLALPTWASVRFAELRTRPDTASQAAQWIEAHLDPAGDPLLLLGATQLPLSATTGSLRRSAGRLLRTDWQNYQMTVPNAARVTPRWDMWDVPVRPLPLGELPDHGVIVMRTEQEDPRATMLRAHSDRLVVFPAVTPGAPLRVNTGYQDSDTLARVLRGVAWGPPLEIRRLR